MMTSVAQSYSPHPGAIQQHPGVPQGHPMARPRNPGQQIPGQPGMPQQMHMGVSGPGVPQVTQAAAMMGGDASRSWRAKRACTTTFKPRDKLSTRKRNCISSSSNRHWLVSFAVF